MQTNQQASLRYIGCLTMDYGLANLNIDGQFARQPFVLAAIAHFGKTEENDASRLEPFGQPGEFLARMIDNFPMRYRVHGGLFDFGDAVRDRSDKTRTLTGAAGKTARRFVLRLNGLGNA